MISAIAELDEIISQLHKSGCKLSVSQPSRNNVAISNWVMSDFVQ
jgi:hypothetical protein